MKLSTKLFLSSILLLLALPVWAQLPQGHYDAVNGMTTLWIDGDLEPAVRALTATSMLFESGIAWGAAVVALLVAILLIGMNIISTTNLQPAVRLAWLVLFLVVMSPKTNMMVANYYDANGMSNAGAVKFRQVDNVPALLAYTIGFFSYMSNGGTTAYETATQNVEPYTFGLSTGQSGVLAGGLSLYGSQGTWSPLKTLIALRRAFSTGGNTLVAANMAKAGRQCNWGSRWNETRNGSFMSVLTGKPQSGTTQIDVVDPQSGTKILTSMNCADAGKVITAQALAMATPKAGETVSDLAKTVATSNSNSFRGTSIAVGDYTRAIQNELNQLPAALASAAGGGRAGANDNPHSILAYAYQRAQATGGNFNPNEMAQLFSAGVAVDSASIQTALMMNRIAARCIYDADCEKSELVLGEALSATAVDAAGEASGYNATYQTFMTAMIVLFIYLTPTMMVIIIIRGVGNFKILGAYLTLLAWLALLKPINTIVGNYMQGRIIDSLYNMVLEKIQEGNTSALLSPAFTEKIFETIQKDILTGSTLMSTAGFGLFLLTGSIYIFTAIANRASMVGQNAVKEQLEAPRLDESPVINSNKMIEQSTATGGPIRDAHMLMGNADAQSGHSINLSSSQGMTEAAKASLSRKMGMMDADSRSVQWAQVDSNGITTSEGMTLNQNKDGSVSWNYSQKGDQVLKDGEQYAIAATGKGNVSGSIGLEAFGTGGKASMSGEIATTKGGKVDNSVSYTDSNGQTHSMNTSTSLADMQSLNTSFGSIDSSNINQAFTQTLSDMRDDQRSLETAANSTVSGGAQASIDAKHLSQIGLNDDRDSAMSQVALAASAAARFSGGVAEAIRQAADRGGNLGADVFQALHTASSGSTAEQLAATAALKAIYDTSHEQAAKPYSAMLESRMDVLTHTQSLTSENRSAIDSPISAADAQGIGRFGSNIDTGRLNGIQERMADGRAAGDNLGRTVRDHEKIMQHNMEARQKDMQEIMAINKTLRERAPSAKLADNLASGTAETLGELKKGNFGILLEGKGMLTSQTGSDYESGKNFALHPDTLKMMERKIELEERIKNYDPNDTTKTYDGAPVESIIGYTPSEQRDAPRIDTRDAPEPRTATAAAPAGSGPMAALKSLMVKGEGNYNTVNLGERHGSRAASRNLTDMTVAEIQRAQERREFNAVGRYQIIRSTFNDGVKALGLSGNEKFTPQLQERFFHDYLLKKAGGGDALAYLNGRHNDLNKAMVAMAKEWASFPVPYDMQGHVQPVKAGQSYYHGVQGNKAHLKINEVRMAMVAARNGSKT